MVPDLLTAALLAAAAGHGDAPPLPIPDWAKEAMADAAATVRRRARGQLSESEQTAVLQHAFAAADAAYTRGNVKAALRQVAVGLGRVVRPPPVDYAWRLHASLLRLLERLPRHGEPVATADIEAIFDLLMW